MGLSNVKYYALITFTYANYIQHQIIKYGVIISLNSLKKIIVNEI